MRKTLFLCLLFAGISTIVSAQGSDYSRKPLDFSQVLITPSFMIGAPYSYPGIGNTKLPINLNVEGRLQAAKLFDAHAVVHLGYFSGITLGGTFHMRDYERNGSTRYIVGESSSTKGSVKTTTTTFYKGMETRRIAIGPTADIKIGSVSATGFYSRLDAGVDLQTWGQSYYKGYASSTNGYGSLRLMATFARFNQVEGAYSSNNSFKEEPVGRTGVGALISANVWRQPWKTSTLYIGLDAGYMAIPGVKDATSAYVTIDNNKSNFLFEIRIGAGLNFFKKALSCLR